MVKVNKISIIKKPYFLINVNYTNSEGTEYSNITLKMQYDTHFLGYYIIEEVKGLNYWYLYQDLKQFFFENKHIMEGV